MIPLPQVAEEISPKVNPQHQKWIPIEITSAMSEAAKRASVRMNAFGSLFYFGKVVLNHSRFGKFHEYLCHQMERDSLRIALEVPRDHFKSTIASVSLPMWWALPFLDDDEELMRYLGYGDAWIRWMKRAHFSSTRTLIAFETLSNARKKGDEIAGHYASNSLFRFLFPEILPKKTDKWNQDSMTHNRVDGQFRGEGTYDFIGVKGALQSRHYDRQVLDDLVGEKAINSDLVMDATINWVKKLPGAFDSDPSDPKRMADQLFIGNRWSNRDLGTWLRKNVIGMQFETHDAEGGCCAIHPAGVPIFPEEYTVEKLAEIRSIFGSYNYAAQYRNNPIDPEAVRFKTSWLRYYALDVWQDKVRPENVDTNQMSDGAYVCNYNQVGGRNIYDQRVLEDRAEIAGAIPQRLRVGIRHEAQSGEVFEDIRAGQLERVAILDPNHSQESGRSRHAIVILGYLNIPKMPRRLYLLDCWAEACSFEKMISKLIGMQEGNLGLAFKWRVHHIYLESEVAGQQGWKYFFQDRVKAMGAAASFTIRPLKTDRTSNGKEKRILGMEPIYENGLFWVRRTGQEAFMQEYESYPNGATKDILDVIGYSPQTWTAGSRTGTRDMVRDELARRQQMIQSVGVAGY